MPGHQQLRVLIRSNIADICFEVSQQRNMIHRGFVSKIIRKISCQDDYQFSIDWNSDSYIQVDNLITIILQGESKKSIKQLEGKYQITGSKKIRFDQFKTLLNQIYYWMEHRFVDSKLKTIFKLLDTDNDGSLDLEQIIKMIQVVSQPSDQSPIKNKNGYRSIQQKSLHFLKAQSIKQNLLKILIRFDKDKDGYLDQNDVIIILKQVLEQNETQIEYTLPIILGSNQKKTVSLLQMSRFLLEKHCGEMSVQRLHSMKLYQNGSQRIMNFQQFSKTLGIALGYFYCTVQQEELEQLFHQIDSNQDGHISYRQYFEFLKSFFSDGQSISRNHHTQRFQGWLDQMSSKKLEDVLINDAKAARSVLTTIFNETQQQVQFAHKNLFKLIIEPSGMSQRQIKKMITFLHMAIIMLLRGHKTKTFKKWNKLQLSCQQFIDLIVDATEWAQIPADTSTLHFVFNQLDTNKDRLISYKQYISFIKHSVDNKTSKQVEEHLISLFLEKDSKPEATQLLKQSLWKMLRQLYKTKLQSGKQNLSISDTNTIISSLIKSGNSEQDYIRWNYSRIDRNNDHEVDQFQFCSFLISHSAQVALQRFHMKQISGKNELNMDEFKELVKDSFGYLQNLDKWDQILESAYNHIQQQQLQAVNYKTFLMWTKKQLAA